MLIQRFKILAITGAATLAIGALVALQAPSQSHAAAACTRLASSSGNDAAAGTPAAPWRTITKLLSSLQPGDVACLAAGQTFGSANSQLSLTTGGVTLQSAPGTPATLIGLFVVSGAGSTVTGLNLDGHNNFPVPGNPATAQGQAGLFIAGNNVSIIGNNITNGHTAICVEVGISRVSGALIDGNRIHGCGILPMTRLEHGIYIDTAVGTRITNNLIYDIADFGIQAYPDSANSLIEGNVIDGTGMGGVTIGSEGGTPSSGNTVRRNIITNSKGAPVATYWGGSVGSGNSAVDNCVANTLSQGSYAGLTVSGTKVVASSGLDASYKLAAGAACTGYGPASSQPGGSGGVTPPPPPPPPPPAPPKPAAPKPPTVPRGGPATPVTGAGSTTANATRTATTTASAASPAITSPAQVVDARQTSKPGARVKLFSYTLTWAGKAGKTYELRIDKGRWFSVKGVKHTFKRLRAGKHKIAVRLKGTHGSGAKRVIAIRA